MPKKLKIKRLAFSSYQSESDLGFEMQSIEALGHIYLNREDSEAADIWISNTHVDFSHLDEKLVKEKDKVKLIIHPNSGYDNFSTDFVKTFSGDIILGNQIRAQAVCEWYLSHLYNHFSKVPVHRTWADDRCWPRELLKDQEVLIIGMGLIGSSLLNTLKSQVKKVHIYDPYIEGLNPEQFNISESKEVPRVVILSPSLTPSSKDLANESFFEKAKEDLIILNASRGEVINNKSLINFLQASNMAHAYLDVFPSEPFDFKVYRDLDNITCTSHIAGVFKDLNKTMTNFITTVIENYHKQNRKDFHNTYHNFILQNKVRTTENGEEFLC